MIVSIAVIILQLSDQRNVDSASGGRSGAGDNAGGEHRQEDGSERRRDREAESGRSDEVDAPDEQSQTLGAGDRQRTGDIRIREQEQAQSEDEPALSVINDDRYVRGDTNFNVFDESTLRDLPFYGVDERINEIFATTPHLRASLEEIRNWVAVVVIIVICLIALILCSVFGVFASGEDSGTGITMRTAVEEINAEYTQKIEDIKSSHTYDKLETSGTRAAWKEVIAVYAVWKNMADTNPANPDEPVEVATMDEGKKEDLRKLFWEMNSVESRTEKKTEKELVEVTEKGKKVKKEKNVTKTYLYITTSHLDLDTMMDKKYIIHLLLFIALIIC